MNSPLDAVEGSAPSTWIGYLARPRCTRPKLKVQILQTRSESYIEVIIQAVQRRGQGSSNFNITEAKNQRWKLNRVGTNSEQPVGLHYGGRIVIHLNFAFFKCSVDGEEPVIHVFRPFAGSPSIVYSLIVDSLS